MSELPRAVLWDMDGTLIDSEPAWIRSEIRLVAEHGGTWTFDDGMTLVGNSLPDSARILQRAGVELSADELIETLMADVDVEVRQEAPWMPGARELVLELRELGVPMALVTSTFRSLTSAFLTHLPKGTFCVVVAGDEVTNSKPHPEPYLNALAGLGLSSSEDVVAVEDSPSGAGSAHAAGIPTLVVGTQPPLPGQVQLPTLAGVSAADLLTYFHSH